VEVLADWMMKYSHEFFLSGTMPVALTLLAILMMMASFSSWVTRYGMFSLASRSFRSEEALGGDLRVGEEAHDTCLLHARLVAHGD
jgi:hypothetical protein